jgi:hypothetical protein
MTVATARVGRALKSRPVLFFAFAFAVMADPVSSVAYAVEAALRALDGDLALLVPTMVVVVAIILLVIVNYRQIIGRYPGGGGAAAAIGEAFGDAWSFIPIGALVVDFVLTIAISVSAASAAIIAYFPNLSPWRLVIALGLVMFVAGATLFGNLGRLLFAVMTLSFVIVAGVVLILGIGVTPHQIGTVTSSPGHVPVIAVILAFPVAMALATGVEAPSSAIAQLGQLNRAGKRRFGQLTLWVTLGVVGVITLGLAAEAAYLRVGVPPKDSTLIAELAHAAAPQGIFALFQLTTALLLLAAASSSFQAGPGLLKALAEHDDGKGNEVGVLPAIFGRTNQRMSPVWGVALFAGLAIVITCLAGADDQILVLFYAVAVFLSFLAGLLAMAKFSRAEHNWRSFLLNTVGALVVAFTLVANLSRGYPLVSLAVALLVAGTLGLMWVRAGRPAGVRHLTAAAESTGGQRGGRPAKKADLPQPRRDTQP